MGEIRLGDMVAGQQLLTIGPEDTVREACVVMATGNIGALPVVDEAGRLIGMVSERDVIKRSVIVYRPSTTTKVREIMTPDPQFLSLAARPRDAALIMREGGFRHVSVCDGDRLVGIVSIRDFDAEGNPRLREAMPERGRRLGDRLRGVVAAPRPG